MNEPVHNSYDPLAFSQDEEKRFLAALGDGYGYSHRHKNLYEEALPSDVNPGLLHHSIYYREFERPKHHSDDDNFDDEEHVFWEGGDPDRDLGLYEQCPVNFHFPSIQKYFQEQKTAYLTNAKSKRDYTTRFEKPKPEEEANFDFQIYSKALYETYSKAWYEFHINEHIHMVGGAWKSPEELADLGSTPRANTMFLLLNAVTLGRLIEQYYWKFIIEKSAIRGNKTVRAAAAGGEALAGSRKAQQRLWQTAADRIWKEHPTFSKKAVASNVKTKLRAKQSAKHISKYLTRP